jgi:hypothetical protein
VKALAQECALRCRQDVRAAIAVTCWRFNWWNFGRPQRLTHVPHPISRR